MHVNFTYTATGSNKTRLLQIDDAEIIWQNFKGETRPYNINGKREFSLVIPNEEIKEALINDVNEYGVGWNVKIREPREEGDEPLIHMKVNVKFNGRGPSIYLKTGDRINKLDEETIGLLDDIEFDRIDMDIRAYDDEFNGRPFRSAYLQSIHVVQKINRFEALYADEYPEE